MKTITIITETDFLGTSKYICVNGERVCNLIKIDKPSKSGYGPREKFMVYNLNNSLELKFWARTARTIKDVIEHLSK